MTLRRFSPMLILAAVLAFPGAAFGQLAQVFPIDNFNDASTSIRTLSGTSFVSGTGSVNTLFSDIREQSIFGSLVSNPGTQIGVTGGSGVLTYIGNSGRPGDLTYNAAIPIDMTVYGDLGFELDIVSALTDPGDANDSFSLQIVVSSGGGTIVYSSSIFSFDDTATGTKWKPMFATDFTGNALALDAVESITLNITSTANFGTTSTLRLDNFTAVPEASPLMMLIGAIAVVGGGRYGWKRYKTRRELAA